MHHFITTAQRWEAVRSRNQSATNSFVYCVTTTRIYCRPDCSSRLARRANVIFLDDASAAEKDGFRACLRCRPDLGQKPDPQKALIDRACELIKTASPNSNNITIDSLAAEVGLTNSHFCRVFKKVMGMTVGGYKQSRMVCTEPVSQNNPQQSEGVHNRPGSLLETPSSNILDGCPVTSTLDLSASSGVFDDDSISNGEPSSVVHLEQPFQYHDTWCDFRDTDQLAHSQSTVGMESNIELGIMTALRCTDLQDNMELDIGKENDLWAWQHNELYIDPNL